DPSVFRIRSLAASLVRRRRGKPAACLLEGTPARCLAGISDKWRRGTRFARFARFPRTCSRVEGSGRPPERVELQPRSDAVHDIPGGLKGAASGLWATQ